eukprot:TRINITY_DN2126_c0_g1_i2.p1 TRINITY_DN2126_c0_g1~~TRINITY_DN2126_c0_g1_i2.p1  ORF type:complete len:141 (+),score=26.75 TRINITY_DN2126_c0_g1_i2:63-485(+)
MCIRDSINAEYMGIQRIMQGARRVPKLVWMTRDFLSAFFGWRTAVTFGYGIVEQGIKVIAPTFMLLYLSRSSFTKKRHDKQRGISNEKKLQKSDIKIYKSDFKQSPTTIHHLQSMNLDSCLLYTSPSPRDATLSRMPSSA